MPAPSTPSPAAATTAPATARASSRSTISTIGCWRGCGATILVVALDRSHERILSSWARTQADADKLALLLSFDPGAGGNLDVPDPYYAGPPMFDEVLGMIESASRALFRQLEPAIRPPS